MLSAEGFQLFSCLMPASRNTRYTRYKLDSITKNATPASMKVTKVVNTLEQTMCEWDQALQSLQFKYTAMELLMRSLANDLVNQEELYKSSQFQVAQLKRKMSELSHQNNQ